MTSHSEHSVWNNYSWGAGVPENENEPPLEIAVNTPPYVDDYENFYWDEEDIDDYSDYSDIDEEAGIAETGIAD